MEGSVMRFRKIFVLALSLLAAAPAGAQTFSSSPFAQRFGGNGLDGAMTVTTTTYNGPIQKNATTFGLASGQTLTCDTGSPVVLLASRTMTIGGTITMTAAGGAGGVGGSTNDYAGGNGAGPGGGSSCDDLGRTGVGGGGGGCGGAGGRGGNSLASTGRGAPGGAAYSNWLGGGSGGGGGGGSSGGTGGAGGTGGSCLILASAGPLVITGTVTCSGTAGTAGTTNGGGGGGGAGGIVWYISRTSVTLTSSTTTVAGANGGAGAGSNGGGGGGGGGGRRYCWSPSNTAVAATATAGSGGAAGGSGQAGENGTTGVSTNLVGYPSNPLLTWLNLDKSVGAPECAWIDRGAGVAWLQAKEQAAIKAGKTVLTINTREMAREVAHGDLNLYARALWDDDSASVCDLETTDAVENAA